MSGKKNFEIQLAAVEALRQLPTEDCTAPLRTALRQRNNYIVAKAADLVAQRRIEELLPDLLAAFDRFFEDAVKSDPQCWAKNSLSRALAALELQEPAPFLRGMRHVQMEPVWGKSSDTAGGLRGICALALVQCRTVPEVDLLRYCSMCCSTGTSRHAPMRCVRLNRWARRRLRCGCGRSRKFPSAERGGGSRDSGCVLRGCASD